MKSSFSLLAMLGALPLALAGCGLSYNYQQQSLVGASDASLCYAATDPRAGGWAVRARAAADLVAQRGIQCDYAAEGLLHVGQAQAQQMAIHNDLDMIETGLKMMQPPPTVTCSGNSGSFTCVGR